MQKIKFTSVIDNNSTKHRTIWICAVLSLVTVAVYYPVWTYDFVNYDDPGYVYHNPNVQSINPETLQWAFTAYHLSNWHPLTWISHMLDWQLFGSKAGGHHLINLILHVLNTLLLFIVLKKMTSAIWQSAFVAALFAIHPLHVQSVAWIAERKDVLSTFFMMLTIWAYLRFLNRKNIPNYLLIVVFFALGLLSKSMLVTLPFVLLLLDYWPLERLWAWSGQKDTTKMHSLSYLLIEKIPLFAMSFGLCIVTFVSQKKGGAMEAKESFTFIIRLANALISYFEYIIKLIWPINLAFFYPHPGSKVSIPYAVTSAVILLAVTILVLLFAKKHRYLITGWFWYLGTLIPVIGLVQVGIQSMADRYTYITYTGLFIIIAWGIPELLKNRPYRDKLLWISSLTILFTLAILSHIEQKHWKNTETLCTQALKVTDNNFNAHYIMIETLQEQGRFNEAIYHSQEAAQIHSRSYQALYSLGLSLSLAGKRDEAIYYYQKVLEIDPNHGLANANLGLALKNKGMYAEAVDYYKRALKTMNAADLYKDLGEVFMKLGRFDEAAANLSEAIRLAPGNAQAYYYLGRVLMFRDNIEQAVVSFEQAIKLKPDWIEPMNDLAWLLAASEKESIRNPQKAITLAHRTCELTGYNNPEFIDTLAVAYASAGDFKKAIEVAEKAIELCKSQGKQTLKEQLVNRLALYKQDKPYIEKL